MPQVRFEPMTPLFERAKAVHAIDSATTVIGRAFPAYIRSFIFNVFIYYFLLQ
jgi:hypothetical protein